MDDLFARAGTVLEHLLNNSTLNGDVKAECLRLAGELKAAPSTLAAQIEDRVRAAVEALDGRVNALEQGKAAADAVVFSTANARSLGLEGPDVTDEEKERLKGLFNGADPKLFDRDGDGKPGGDLTVSEIKAKLAVLEVEFDPKARKDELRKLLDDAEASASKAAEKAAEDPAPVLSAGTGDDTLSGS